MTLGVRFSPMQLNASVDKLVKSSDLGSEVCVGSTPTRGTNAPVVKLVRHVGLKILCLEHAGSIPAWGTIIF